jgi:DNA-binding GntR family transcriptional regulator
MLLAPMRSPRSPAPDVVLLSGPPLKVLNQAALRDRIVGAIRDAVIQGKLRPGEKVPEDDLAQAFGVSRTPVREAIRILEQQGLVRVLPKRGTYIAAADQSDETDRLAVRVALEALAVGQALERSDAEQWDHLCAELDVLIDRMQSAVASDDLVTATELDVEFHTALVRQSANDYLLRTWHLVGVDLLVWTPERDLYAQPAPELTVGLVAAHRALLDALRTRDTAACTAAVRSHIETKIAQMSSYAK